MLNKLKTLLPKTTKEYIRNHIGQLGWARLSWSQEGEDLILSRIFDNQKNGFYVEVGAHHPFRFSNTFLFYKNGWRGIAIDPLPGTKRLFTKHRPRDIAVEMGVGTREELLSYYMFSEPALNSFDKQYADEMLALGRYKLLNVKKVQCKSLSAILDEYMPIGVEIDFMSIDAEARDLDVLTSNCWKKYRPRVIVAESINPLLHKISEDPVANFLKEVGYVPYAKAKQSVIYLQSVEIDSKG